MNFCIFLFDEYAEEERIDEGDEEKEAALLTEGPRSESLEYSFRYSRGIPACFCLHQRTNKQTHILKKNEWDYRMMNDTNSIDPRLDLKDP